MPKKRYNWLRARKVRALVFRRVVSSPLCAAKACSQSGECMRNIYNGSIPNVGFIRMKQPRAPWIDSFFFRASTMVPQSKRLVLSLGQSMPPAVVKPLRFITFGGYIDYAVLSASVPDSGRFLQWFYFSSSFSAGFHARPCLNKFWNTDHKLFVAETKSNNISLEGHVPPAVGEMYACAKRVGCLWYFPILNDNAAAEKNCSWDCDRWTQFDFPRSEDEC